MRRAPLILLCAVAAELISPTASAAEPQAKRVRAELLGGKLSIDGKLDEPAWQKARKHGDFVERQPKLRGKPPVETRFSVLFDQEALYVGIWCRDDQPDRIAARTRGRDDFSLFRDDAVSLKIDPTDDKRTTIGFAINPAGGKLDYRGIDESDFRVEFDAVWQGAAARTTDGWSAELRIPYDALGIDPAAPPERLGFNISRDHSRRTATYDWALLPPPFSPIAASRYGDLVGLVPPEGAARGTRLRNLTITPYALGGLRRETDDASSPLESQALYNAGLDLRGEIGRWRGQLTLNTDFAQVDLDDQVANLSRFGLFVPEKRGFFLNDLELLSFGKEGSAQMLYSRRIGLSDDGELPIVGGLKLVGRPHRRFRLGALQVTTRPGADMPWTSNAVLRGLLELGGGSNAGLMITHRQSLENTEDRNLMIGIDGAWRGGKKLPLLVETFAVGSLTGSQASAVQVAAGGEGSGDYADKLAPGATIKIALRDELVRPTLHYAYYHPELRGDLGFFRRVGVQSASASLELVPRIGKRGLERVNAGGYGGLLSAAEGDSLLDYHGGGFAALKWNKGYSLGVNAYYAVETVDDSFTVGRDTEIPAGSYEGANVSIFGGTPGTKSLSTNGQLFWRDYYGGQLLGTAGGVSWLPAALLRLDVGYNYAHASFQQLPSFDTLVLNGRFTFGFSSRLGLKVSTGYNLLDDLVQLQSRLRWIYGPGRDLFLVYQVDLDDDTARPRFVSMIAKTQFRIDAL